MLLSPVHWCVLLATLYHKQWTHHCKHCKQDASCLSQNIQCRPTDTKSTEPRLVCAAHMFMWAEHPVLPVGGRGGGSAIVDIYGDAPTYTVCFFQFSFSLVGHNYSPPGASGGESLFCTTSVCLSLCLSVTPVLYRTLAPLFFDRFQNFFF